jgi:hypothetical protein
MLRRIELDESLAAQPFASAPNRAESIVPAVAETECESPLLPQDHPHWVRDAIAVSARARDVLAKLRPVAVRVLCFWDHRIRSIVVGNRRVAVDPGGCYRIDA